MKQFFENKKILFCFAEMERYLRWTLGEEMD